MITTTQMYWLTRLDHLKIIVGGIGGFFIVMTFLLFVFTFVMFLIGNFSGNGTFDMFSDKTDDELNDVHKRFRGISLRFLVVSFISFLISISLPAINALTPTTREMAAIVMVPAVVNNERVQTVGNKLYELAIEWMEELKPIKKEEKK